MSMVHTDDVIIHYADGFVRAISTALGAAEDANRPDSLPAEPWDQQGWLLRVQLADLDSPISLAEIPQELRLDTSYQMFDQYGNVKQGYLYPADVNWFGQFTLRFAARLPSTVSIDTVAPAEATGGAADLLRGLIGEELHTLTGEPNTILRIDGVEVIVATDHSPDGEHVLIRDVQSALDILTTTGSVACDPNQVVGAVLRTLPGVDVSLSPPTVRLGQHVVVAGISPHKSTGKAPAGPTDIAVMRYARSEQPALRRTLVANRTMAHCALCSREMPVELLVAAHIKKREVCSEKERGDLVNIGMLACKFGCDDLYEIGYITVDDTGTIHTVEPDAARHGATVVESLTRLNGQHCRAFTEANRAYFDWHRANTSRVPSVTTL